MKIEILVNGKTKCVAGLSLNGELMANLITKINKKESVSKINIKCHASVDKNEWHWKGVDWPSIDAKSTDIVSFKFDSNKKVSPAITKLYNSGPHFALIKNKKFAKKVSALTKNFRKNLIGLIEEAKRVEGDKNGRRFQLAVGHIVYEVFERIDVPVQRDHPDIKG